MPSDDHRGAVTADHLLGGRVRYTQPRDGLRAAIDPVLLAAAIPAKAGERVFEGGTGAGAALLCLAARVEGLRGTGIDRAPLLVRLARANAIANGWPGLGFAVGDLNACPVGGTMDHAFANPPYHAPGGSRSPSDGREAAKRSSPGLLSIWAAALARPLRHRGTLTFILAPWLLEAALMAFRDAQVPVETVFPVWPMKGREARLILVRGRKNGRAHLRFASGLILHTDTGAFRPEAEAILRGGAALCLGRG
ncbi:MAG: hypothetical protein EXR07_06950 [Acetobacteraceae bacterium]|nr:hypothetical protein [Acetobacteraceae bacterium]